MFKKPLGHLRGTFRTPFSEKGAPGFLLRFLPLTTHKYIGALIMSYFPKLL